MKGSSDTGPRLTLRQIEVIRAVMVTGTIAGAARLLNVSAPGLSRLVRYTEESAGVRLFDRSRGRFIPTQEAQSIFNLLDMVYGKVEDLQKAIASLQRGSGQRLSLASVPSIGNVMVPRAIAALRRTLPELELDLDIIKIDEVIDYLLLGHGELMVLSSAFEHSVIDLEPLATGRLLCVVPDSSDLATRTRIAAHEIAKHPLVAVTPEDPYGVILSRVLHEQGLAPPTPIRVRFGATACRMVAEGLGIAIIDEFTVAGNSIPGITLLDIEEGPRFDTWVAYRNDRQLSDHARRFIEVLREVMQASATQIRAS